MKRIVCISMIVSLFVLYFFSCGNSFFSVVKKSSDTCYLYDTDFNSYWVVRVDSDHIDSIMTSLNFEKSSVLEINGRKIIEGYSNMFSNYIVSDNRKINIQISINDNFSLIGYPLIKNSF